jgi:hypothetical protein
VGTLATVVHHAYQVVQHALSCGLTHSIIRGKLQRAGYADGTVALDLVLDGPVVLEAHQLRQQG